MRPRTPWLLGPLLLVSLPGCFGIPVDADWDPGFDFAALETYAWLEPGGDDAPRGVNTLVRERIERAVDPVLHRRGLREVVPASAQLLVAAHVGIDERYDVTTTTYGWGLGFGGWGYGPFGYGGPTFTDTIVRRVEQGTLILDLIDPATQRLVWRGMGRLDLQPRGTPEDRERSVRDTVEAILAQFPPGRRAD